MMRKHKPQNPNAGQSLGASFRDPAGFMFKDSRGRLLRQINPVGQADFDLFVSSGLYDALTKDGSIVSHKPVKLAEASTTEASAVIKPEQLAYISYPFEWSFSQLQDAARLTLAIQRQALRRGMSLKDASAYNIQFRAGKPIFIDSLSFEKYEPGKAWSAYRQFCQHFLAPLALMTYTDVSLSQLLRVHLDGIPLELASKLLSRRAKLKPGLAMHVVMHGKAQKSKAREHRAPARAVSQRSLEAIIDSLERTVTKLKPPKSASEWGDYYDKTNYTTDAADQKAKLITKLIKPLSVGTALDLGGNNGRYSRVLHDLNIFTVCTDIDPNAVEANYRYMKHHDETKMLPLVVDLTNPGGALGWQNDEREPIHVRLQADVVMALALVHHLAISGNLPFDHIARYFRNFGPYLLIEFVPKDDSQVKKLLSTRKDIFPDYTEIGFKQVFENYYTLLKEQQITGTKRTLYLFKRTTD